MSSIDASLSSPLKPYFTQIPPATEENSIQPLIKLLQLQTHPEGGYFVETDRDPFRIPNPFTPTSSLDTTRNASTTIFYLITPASPKGNFHKNNGRTVHTLHRGRGRYVVIHPPDIERGEVGKTQIETFVVGQDLDKGERLQWIVEGGRWKACFLLPDDEVRVESGGLLISETVVPGFEFADHEFLLKEKLPELVTEEQARELKWLLKNG